MCDYESDENKLYKCQNTKCNKDVILYNRFDCHYCYKEVCRKCATKEKWVMCAVCEITICRKCMTERKKIKYCPEPDCSSSKNKEEVKKIGMM
jgi:hypothetical protein